MTLVLNWIKRNKLATVLVLVVLYLLLKKSSIISPLNRQYSSLSIPEVGVGSMGSISSSKGILPVPINEAPPTNIKDRMVVQELNLSLVVKNVRESVDKATEFAKSTGGYMISSTLSQPEEAPYATLSLRIPAKNLKTALDYFRSLSIKVTSENLYGTDVTDEYTDIDARLETLNKTKAKFEEIMNKAINVQDILTVQRELINLQDQIDSLKGRQQYLEKTAEMARVTIYLSTDEFALPYAPAGTFRPEVILKTAVRSLVGFLRWIVKAGIWIGVFGVVWIPVLVIVLFLKRRKKLPKV